MYAVRPMMLIHVTITQSISFPHIFPLFQIGTVFTNVLRFNIN
jgi:hypothetical protein